MGAHRVNHEVSDADADLLLFQSALNGVYKFILRIADDESSRMGFVREQFYLVAMAQNLKRLERFRSCKPTPQIATAPTV